MSLEIFESHKKEILKYLNEFLNIKKQNYSFLKPWGKDVIEKIDTFTSGGKMIRGGLIMLMANLLGSSGKQNAVKASAAMELVQTSLLIHDDIMDRDTVRRGKKTVFFQYKEAGDAEKIKDSYHFGEGMGICAGDIGFFLAFEILSELDCEPEIQRKLLSLFSKEITLVGLGQMQDLYFGSLSGIVSEESIYQVYTHKTARYTFSLPMLMGAVLAKAGPEIQETLSQLGESMGVVFQIRDDELGLFGDEKEIGKPVGADIKEEKKTLYYYYLFQKAVEKDRKKLKKIFGNPKINEKEVEWVRNKVLEYGIQDLINKKVDELAEKTRQLILKLGMGQESSQYLELLLDYNLKRKK